MSGALTASQILQAGLAGAAVVVFGGLYALFLAWYRLHGRRGYRSLAFLFYAALVGAFFILARALALDHLWQFFIALLLLAYLLAPQWIWQLTSATHAVSDKLDDSMSSTTKINKETGL